MPSRILFSYLCTPRGLFPSRYYKEFCNLLITGRMNAGRTKLNKPLRKTDENRQQKDPLHVIRLERNYLTSRDCTRRQVLAAVKVQIMVFWVVAPCSLVGGFKRFGGTYCLHLQSRSKVQAIRSYETLLNHLYDYMVSKPKKKTKCDKEVGQNS
jgi:hypothetical protein